MSMRKNDNKPNSNKTVVSASVLPHIKKLDGQNNYNSWKFFMKLYLIHEDLWECVTSNRNDTDLTLKERRRDQKARSKICLMIQPHCLIHVRNDKTAKEVWNSLQNAFENKGLTRRLCLLKKLFY